MPDGEVGGGRGDGEGGGRGDFCAVDEEGDGVGWGGCDRRGGGHGGGGF